MHPQAPSSSDNGLMSALTMPFLDSVMDSLDPMFSPIEDPILRGPVPFMSTGKCQPTAAVAVPMPMTVATAAAATTMPTRTRATHTIPASMDPIRTGGEVPAAAATRRLHTVDKTIPASSQYTRHSMPDISAFSSASKRRRRRTIGHAVTHEDEEERRRMFLERNRQAALKCRLRKKQWLADLQNHIEYLDADNKQLEHQVFKLREEVLNLRTLIIAHADCPVAKQQRRQYQDQDQPLLSATNTTTTSSSSTERPLSFEFDCS